MIYAITLAFLLLLCVVSAGRVEFPHMSFTGPLHARQFTQVGAAAPSAPVEFVVALKQRNLDVLERLFWEVSDPEHERYQQFMTPEEISAIVGNPEAAQVVQEKLRAIAGSDANLEIVSRGDSLAVSTVSSVASAIFNVAFYRYRHVKTGVEYIRSVKPLSMDSEIAQFVDFVEGLTEFPLLSHRAHRRLNQVGSQGLTLGNPSTDLITPQFVKTIYNIDAQSLASATGSSQGVIQWDGQYYTETDLKSYLGNLSLPYSPLQPNHILGGNQNQDGEESQMDIELIAGMNPLGTNWFIENNQAWVYVFANWFANLPQVPNVISISYGLEEDSTCSNMPVCNGTAAYYFGRCNTELQKIGLRGVSVMVSSGDSGANGRSNEQCQSPVLSPSFPASSPFVTAVGATQIDNPVYNLPNAPAFCKGSQFTCISGGVEVAVSYNYSNYASGGGFSNYSSMPAYQQTAVQAYLKSGVQFPPASYFSASGRSIPDVSAFGISGFEIINGAMDNQGDGTSMSSPTFSGVISILNAQAIKITGKPLGFLNPLLYKMWETNPETFNDIIYGDNLCTESGCQPGCQGFVCTRGYDAVTGLGSPNYGNMLKYIQQLAEARKSRIAIA